MVATQAGARKTDDFIVPRFVNHPSFQDPDAVQSYCPGAESPAVTRGASQSHLPDESTRELSKAMHYAAFRLNAARLSGEARVWRNRYLELRNRIILGNRKLIYRAVQTRVRDRQLADDCAAECNLVMIRAVTAYNPWLGIRFSTYAFTCLLRELTRLVQRQVNDRLRQAVSFDDGLFDDANEPRASDAEPDLHGAKVRQFLTTEHNLLTEREKQVLSKRFGFDTKGSAAKLQDIGSALKISKERVRQVQNGALEKLRDVFATECVEA